MSRLFPFRSSAEIQDETPRVLSLSGDEADDVFAALSSGTARTLLAALYDEPRPTSELADELDTSIQNARYHLGNLQDAGLVEVVDTWYSEQGNEMKVYAPTNGALVLFEGEPETRTTLREAVTRLLGGVGVLGLAALLIDRGGDLVDAVIPKMGSPPPGTTTGGDGASGGDGGGAVTTTQAGGGAGQTRTTAEATGTIATPPATTTEGTATASRTTAEATQTTAEATQTTVQATHTTAAQTTVETTTAATRTTVEATQTTVQATTTTAAAPTAPPGSFEALTGVPLTPGLAFFLGGLVVLLAAFALWYRARGPL